MAETPIPENVAQGKNGAVVTEARPSYRKASGVMEFMRKAPAETTVPADGDPATTTETTQPTETHTERPAYRFKPSSHVMEYMLNPLIDSPATKKEFIRAEEKQLQRMYPDMTLEEARQQSDYGQRVEGVPSDTQPIELPRPLIRPLITGDTSPMTSQEWAQLQSDLTTRRSEEELRQRYPDMTLEEIRSTRLDTDRPASMNRLPHDVPQPAPEEPNVRVLDSTNEPEPPISSDELASMQEEVLRREYGELTKLKRDPITAHEFTPQQQARLDEVQTQLIQINRARDRQEFKVLKGPGEGMAATNKAVIETVATQEPDLSTQRDQRQSSENNTTVSDSTPETFPAESSPNNSPLEFARRLRRKFGHTGHKSPTIPPEPESTQVTEKTSNTRPESYDQVMDIITNRRWSEAEQRIAEIESSLSSEQPPSDRDVLNAERYLLSYCSTGGSIERAGPAVRATQLERQAKILEYSIATDPSYDTPERAEQLAEIQQQSRDARRQQWEEDLARQNAILEKDPEDPGALSAKNWDTSRLRDLDEEENTTIDREHDASDNRPMFQWYQDLRRSREDQDLVASGTAPQGQKNEE